MRCQQVQKYLSAYFDGMSSPEASMLSLTSNHVPAAAGWRNKPGSSSARAVEEIEFPPVWRAYSVNSG